MNVQHVAAAALILLCSVPAYLAGFGKGYVAGWLDRKAQQDRGLKRLADDLRDDREW